MTEITKPIHRRTRQPLQRWGPDAKKIVITIAPLGGDDCIELRLERRRQPYRIMVDDLYRYLVRQTVLHKEMARVRAHIGKRKRRVRRK
jgi:hypothetical protein